MGRQLDEVPIETLALGQPRGGARAAGPAAGPSAGRDGGATVHGRDYTGNWRRADCATGVQKTQSFQGSDGGADEIGGVVVDDDLDVAGRAGRANGRFERNALAQVALVVLVLELEIDPVPRFAQDAFLAVGGVHDEVQVGGALPDGTRLVSERTLRQVTSIVAPLAPSQNPAPELAPLRNDLAGYALGLEARPVLA